ncbi:MAG: dNTP triphosphohydrolase [Salinivirgaceae bacterium]|nr:dNTP triphosphohydrolase [Salinivirgaceae bacterium]MDY0280652.1 dNTP triphosphohydrolase [Salinivirgaceae bacterium]
MQWTKLLNGNRFGDQKQEQTTDIRSQFQRDYDRLVFSPEFRKLQSKTQVFPLPGEIFVHNRLTHSLEVASVGKSIASLVTEFIIKKSKTPAILLNEIPTVVATACLAHDIGNPPFGHSGEDAISSYFLDGEGQRFQNDFSITEWTDLTRFEGNANVLRLLTHQYSGRRAGGFALTYASLASMIKYPYPSTKNKKKYGYFNTEEHTFNKIIEACALNKNGKTIRHPLVFLVEAADDISYLIMDIEDAHRLDILTTEHVFEYLLPFVATDAKQLQRFNEQSINLSDEEKIAYLRSLTINILVKECANIFIKYYNDIMIGELETSLASLLPAQIKPLLNNCQKLGQNKIYTDEGVRKLEISGHKVLTTLIRTYIEAALSPHKYYSKLLISTIPPIFNPSGSFYNKVRLITDYISSMTDTQAVKLYRELMGIDIPQRTQ